ncbi:MAG TPA: hypothetical protein VGJ06_02820 [Candidatus Acidoferrum sp.]|jgi:hypothetical protein
MDQKPNDSSSAPAGGTFPPIVRAVGIGVLVLILWTIDKIAVSHLPQGSVWRYIVGGVIISVGLATVLSFADRLTGKQP